MKVVLDWGCGLAIVIISVLLYFFCLIEGEGEEGGDKGRVDERVGVMY